VGLFPLETERANRVVDCAFGTDGSYGENKCGFGLPETVYDILVDAFAGFRREVLVNQLLPLLSQYFNADLTAGLDYISHLSIERVRRFRIRNFTECVLLADSRYSFNLTLTRRSYYF